MDRYLREQIKQGATAYVLTAVQNSFEADAKRKFIKERYPEVKFKEFIAVNGSSAKLQMIRSIAKRDGIRLEDCELVEDDYDALLKCAAEGVNSVHVSNLAVLPDSSGEGSETETESSEEVGEDFPSVQKVVNGKKLKGRKLKKRLRKNAEKAEKRGYDRHLYLETLGIPIEKCGSNFCDKSDERYGKWMKQRRKYGFDERETWNLDYVFFEWLYERLTMYREKASRIVNLEYHRFTVDGRKFTQLEAIDRMLTLLETILKNGDDFNFDEKSTERTTEILKIWTAVLPAMWW